MIGVVSAAFFALSAFLWACALHDAVLKLYRRQGDTDWFAFAFFASLALFGGLAA